MCGQDFLKYEEYFIEKLILYYDCILHMHTIAFVPETNVNGIFKMYC